MKTLLKVLCLIGLVNLSLAFSLECYLNMDKTCDFPIISANDRTVTSVIVNGTNGQTADDIDSIFEFNVNLQHFPRGLGNFFPNLTEIRFSNVSITELSKDDFVGLGNLKTLIIATSPTCVVEEDTFDYLTNLEVLALEWNYLIYIDPKIFDKLTKLRAVLLTSNQCIATGGFWNIPISKQIIINGIKAKCSNPDVLNIHKSLKSLQNDLDNSNSAVFNKNFGDFESKYENSVHLNNTCFKSRYESLKAQYVPPPTCQTCCKLNDVAADVQNAIQNLETKVSSAISNLTSIASTKSDVDGVITRIQDISNTLANANATIRGKIDSIATQICKFPQLFANLTTTIKGVERKVNDRLDWVEYRLKKVEKKMCCSGHRRE